MEGSIHMYCINLKQRGDRWKRFSEQPELKELMKHHSFERFEGISGATIDIQGDSRISLRTKRNIKEHIRRDHEELDSAGGVGCYLSHTTVWKQFLERPEPYAIIFEDDAIFCEDFEKKLEETVQNKPIDTDILFFGGRFDADFKMEEGTYLPISENIVAHKSIRWEQRNHRNHDRTYIGYIISNKLANSLIQHFNKMIDTYLPIDQWAIKYCMNNGIQILNTYPLLCHSPKDSPESDIRWSSSDKGRDEGGGGGGKRGGKRLLSKPIRS